MMQLDQSECQVIAHGYIRFLYCVRKGICSYGRTACISTGVGLCNNGLIVLTCPGPETMNNLLGTDAPDLAFDITGNANSKHPQSFAQHGRDDVP